MKKSSIISLKVKKTLDNAIIPSSAYEGDAGLDIYLIKLDKIISDSDNNITHIYRTGLSFELPEGYYIEIFERSSLYKYGYSLANGTAIIDNGFRGEVIIPLRKHKSGPITLQLPFKGVQMIIKKMIPCVIEEVEYLTNSERGDRGFGSSGHT